MAKKTIEVDTEEINDLLVLGKKILKLVYLFMIVALVIGAISIGNSLNIFGFLLSILRILSPLFIGFIIAWLFNPFVEKMYKRKIPKVAGSFIVFGGIILFLAVFIGLFVPVITTQVNQFLGMVPELVTNLTSFLEKTFDAFGASGIDVNEIGDSLTNSIQGMVSNLAISIPENAFNIASSFFSWVFTAVLSFIIGLYMLIDFDNIQQSFLKFIPRKNQVEVVTLLTNIGMEVRKVVNGILLIASMVFVFDTIGFALVGLEAALLLGLFCGITDLIPYVGPYIGGGVAILVGYSQGPVVGTGVLIIALVVQLLENYVFQPVVMSKASQTHPVIIMVALLIFGYFFGIVGMILATPSLAIFKVVFSFFDNKFHIFSDKRENKLVKN